jgi:hypothetical protein
MSTIYNNYEYKIHLQPIRVIYVKLDILNNNENIVYQLETEAIDGSINLDEDSPSRRICNLQLVYKQKLMPDESSPIWLNKKIRVFIGIKDLIKEEIIYFNYGIFFMSSVSIECSISESKIIINCLDKMAFLDGTISGQMIGANKITVEAGTPIHEAIKNFAITYGFETKFLIDNHEENTEYTIEKKSGDTVWSVLDELTKLYFNWQCYYDKDGYLNFNKKKNKLADPVIFSFKNKDMRISHNVTFDFSNIKNSYVVYGKLLKDGTQPKANYEITNLTEPNSPFTIEKIGKRTFVETKDKYTNLKQCQEYLNFQKFKHTNFNEQISFECIPFYFLDIGDVIECETIKDSKIYDKYVINKINIGLKYDSPMSIVAYKIY